MYTFESHIRYSEVDPNRKLTIDSLIDYFQDTASFHGEEAGNGIEEMKKRKLAWLISTWYVRIYRMPQFCEKVKSVTGVCGTRMLYPVRLHKMLAEDGSVCAEGYSQWLILDTQTGHPVRIPDWFFDCYEIDEPLSFPNMGRHVRLPEKMEEREPFPVRSCEIDTNGHVNNGQYVRMAEGYLPENFIVRAVQVEYRKAAFLGDMIAPYLAFDGKGCGISLRDGNGKPYVNIYFEGEKDA